MQIELFLSLEICLLIVLRKYFVQFQAFHKQKLSKGDNNESFFKKNLVLKKMQRTFLE